MINCDEKIKEYFSQLDLESVSNFCQMEHHETMYTNKYVCQHEMIGAIQLLFKEMDALKKRL